MFKKRIVSVLAVLFLSASTLARGQGIEKEIITGTVVGYDIGLELANGSCRQTIIIRKKNRIKHMREYEYIIVRYEDSCMKLIPERVLKTGPQWRFSLTRNSDCDRLLDDLLYIKERGPFGIHEIPLLKRVRGAAGEQIPTDTKLACHVLRPGEFEPPLKQRLITGVVIPPYGHLVKGAYVRLRFTDSHPHLVVAADDHGRFTIPIFEGFSYAVQAELKVGDRTIYGELVQIPTVGGVESLRLVIK